MLSLPMRSPPQAVEAVIERIRAVYSRWKRDTSAAQMRQDWDSFLWREVAGVRTTEVGVGALKARWIDAAGADASRVLLYFHGGGYKMGSSASHHELMCRLSAVAGCRVLGLDYRLLPEHRFPAPLEDAAAAWSWLQEQGYAPRQIVVAGDSAGGGLAAALLLQLREAGAALPAAAVLLSALTDLETRGASYDTRAARDPIHNRALIQALARQYLGAEGDARQPLASPLNGELAGLPPLLLQVGDRETGLDDSVLFAQKAAAAGVPVTLEVWEGMIHVFQQFPDELAEARDAVARIGAFLNHIWSTK
ncbi:MAG TPA: alpha/beta hydrolase [Nevskia sp.]|nr:alpha/beta hydrolase [Nevskia sp.]